LYKLERYRLKHGQVSNSYLESSNQGGKMVESSRKVPDWRKFRPTLSPEQVEQIANLTPDQMKSYASDTGFTYKTISNWRSNCREELGIDSESN